MSFFSTFLVNLFQNKNVGISVFELSDRKRRKLLSTISRMFSFFVWSFSEHILILNVQSMNLLRKLQRAFYLFPPCHCVFHIETWIFLSCFDSYWNVLFRFQFSKAFFLWDINILCALSAVFAKSNDFTGLNFSLSLSLNDSNIV